MIRRIILKIHESGVIDTPILIVSPQSLDLFQKAFAGLNCKYVLQQEPRGLRDAFKTFLESKVSFNESFLFLVIDNPMFSSETISELDRSHAASGTNLTLFTTTIPNEPGFDNLKSFTRIERSEDV